MLKAFLQLPKRAFIEILDSDLLIHGIVITFIRFSDESNNVKSGPRRLFYHL